MATRINPSPDAKHVRIGRGYREARFERRQRDGTYEALMPGNRLQLSPSAPLISGRTLLGSIAIVAVLAVAVLVFPT